MCKGHGVRREGGGLQAGQNMRAESGEVRVKLSQLQQASLCSCTVILVFCSFDELKASWDTVSTMGGVPDHSKRSSAWCAGELGVQPELPSQTLSQNKVKIGLQYSGRTHA